MGTQRGFTYLALLLAIALLGIGLAAASEVWSTVAKRQRMEQLEWVGQQYLQAIGSYYESSPGPVKAYPKTLKELLDDKRFAFARRYLRQEYVNPFSGRPDWVLVRSSDGGIRGIRVELEPQAAGGPKEREFVYIPLAPMGGKQRVSSAIDRPFSFMNPTPYGATAAGDLFAQNLRT